MGQQWERMASGDRAALPSGPRSPGGAIAPAGPQEGLQRLQTWCLTEFALLQVETVFIALFPDYKNDTQSFVKKSNHTGGHADNASSSPAPGRVTCSGATAAGWPGTRPRWDSSLQMGPPPRAVL